MALFWKKKSPVPEGDADGQAATQTADPADTTGKAAEAEEGKRAKPVEKGKAAGVEKAKTDGPAPKAATGQPAAVAGKDGKPAEPEVKVEEEEDKRQELKRDTRKAAAFFKHAGAVADARNYDYAIELYISGLRHDPDRMPSHEALRDIALRRKVGGGKPASFFERSKLKLKGKGKLEKFLNAVQIWSKDPLNLAAMLDTMAAAIACDYAYKDCSFSEIAHWIGLMILEKNETDRPLSKDNVLKLRDLFTEMAAFDQAIAACRWALELDPNDMDLEGEMKDLEAEKTLAEDYSTRKAKEVDFRKNVRDMDQQKLLEAEDQLGKSEEALTAIIAKRREDFTKNPDDMAAREKLIKALLESHKDDSDNEAAKLLEEAHKKTGNYKHQMMIGNIRIRQMDRQLLKLKDAVAKSKDDAALKEKYREAQRTKLRYEMQQFAERIKNYPTEMRWRYELGKRFHILKRYDKAVENLQRAVSDPKYRAPSYGILGLCYVAQGWYDEAIETFQKGIAAHKQTEDKLALEMRYDLMDAYVKAAERDSSLDMAKKAAKVASEILQTDINFRDIRQRAEQIRTLAKKLQGDKQG